MTSNLAYLYILLTIVNLVAFIWVGVDKKKSINHSERVPEVYLFFIAIFFASLGVFLGMLFFRHKTRKIYFPLGIGILFIEQSVLLLLLSKIYG